MFVGIGNTPRDYAWGSRTAIAELLGRPASGGPEAELWLGAHPGSPSVVTAATPGLAGRRLDEVLAPDGLPFLLKVLAADGPLSLQVHPDRAQAEAGFARENESGIALDAPERNYRDASDKPELILALSPSFEALAGFRHLSEARMLLAELAGYTDGDDRAAVLGFADRLAAGNPSSAGSGGSSRDVTLHGMPDEGGTDPHHTEEGNALRKTVEWVLGGGEDVERLVAAVSAAAGRAPTVSSYAREWATVGSLAAAFPGDPGVVLSLLLNRVSLQRGQVMALPAGVLHAYLSGLGVELMSSSDNVLRGGLTGKHVDVEELLRVVRFEAQSPEMVRPVAAVAGVTVWQPAVGDFLLAQVALGDAAGQHGYALAGPESTAFDLSGPAIVLAVTGGLRIDGASGTITLGRGDAAYVSPEERTLTFSGSGIAFVATTP